MSMAGGFGPSSDATQFNEPESVDLSNAQRGTITFTGNQPGTRAIVPTLAISKFPDSTYEVKADGQTIYGPAPVPPTDVDDLSVTFLPPVEFSDELKVIIDNTGTSTNTYVAQPIGWEEGQ